MSKQYGKSSYYGNQRTDPHYDSIFIESDSMEEFYDSCIKFSKISIKEDKKIINGKTIRIFTLRNYNNFLNVKIIYTNFKENKLKEEVALAEREAIKKMKMDLNQNNEDLFKYCRKGYYENVKMILEKKNVDINYEHYWMLINSTSLMVASKHNHKDIVELLLENGADCYKKDEKGHNVLMNACRHSKIEIIKLLIEKMKENINLKNSYGDTALMISSFWGKAEVIKLLLNNNADYCLYNNQEKTMLIKIIEGYNFHEERHIFYTYKEFTLSIKYLREHETDIDILTNGSNVIIKAIQCNCDIEMIEQLVLFKNVHNLVDGALQYFLTFYEKNKTIKYNSSFNLLNINIFNKIKLINVLKRFQKDQIYEGLKLSDDRNNYIIEDIKRLIIDFC